jgi:superoxide dismutase, Fe-Mn family
MNNSTEPFDISRRLALSSLAAGVTLMIGCEAKAQGKPPMAPNLGAAQPTPAPTTQGAPHAVKPLHFQASALRGLSEKLIVSHHDNNYAGAVKNLNRVEEELARVTKDTPAFVVGGLKQSELNFRNSATLHELYFGNLGGDGRASGRAEKLFGDAEGSFARWQERFLATGASLGGGSGWVITAWDLHRDVPVTFWSGNHSQGAAMVVPLLVMDMYEHAYQLDYGAASAKYMDAFFQNIQWDEVNARLERAQKSALLFRSA